MGFRDDKYQVDDYVWIPDFILAQISMSTPSSSQACRSVEPRSFDFLVIGAGPGGLTAVAKLIDHGIDRIAWIDPSFCAGRIGERFTQVPSNTKIQLFIDYVHSSPTFSKLVQGLNNEGPNAYSTLEGLERDRGNVLKYASDLFIMLTKQLISSYPEAIKSFRGRVRSVDLADKYQRWTVNLESDELPSLNAKKIILAIGAEPKKPSRPIIPAEHEIDLEVALSPSKLEKIIRDIDLKSSSIAVLGSSHSALLVLKNLIDLSQHLTIFHIYRSGLKFAEFRDGWILYDNTGLKGLVADWARNEYPRLVDQHRILKFKISSDDGSLTDSTAKGQHDPLKSLDPRLKDSSRVIYAMGYRTAKTVKVSIDGIEIDSLEFDHLTGRFGNVPHLFGCGIGFPQRVVDPLGNVEHAVGVYKFMKFLTLVVPTWIQTTSDHSSPSR